MVLTSLSTTFLRLVRNLLRDPQLTITISPNRSSQTLTSAKHSSLSAPSSQPRSSSTSRQTSPSALVSHHKYSPESNFISNRICLVHHQRSSPRRHPGHERLPGWHQEAQGPTEEAQGRKQTLLNKKQGCLSFHRMTWKKIQQVDYDNIPVLPQGTSKSSLKLNM